tara:strand:- start:520 stop:687 length:168 start_codon:yes stop_codon:yes gene_type:complete
MDHSFYNIDLVFDEEYSDADNLYLETRAEPIGALTRRDLEAIAKYFGCLIVEDLK